MRTIVVTYETQVPDEATDEQVMEWLRYVLDERQDTSENNPMRGCGAEPDVNTISFNDKA